MLSLIIPANNEADYIGDCLEALLTSTMPEHTAPSGDRVADGQRMEAAPEVPPVEIIVVANACKDATIAVARGFEAAAAARRWRLIVLDLEQGGKLNAINAGDRAATGASRVYIDADVIVSPPLLDQLRTVLDRPGPAYASGRPVTARARSWVSRAYARTWRRVPFMTEGVPGCGVFAVNAAGRARWGAFPEIISDDTFTRLQFAPAERIGVPASYCFPMAEGFAALVRVRRRQDVGVTQVTRLYPALIANEDRPGIGLSRLLGLAARDPVGFGVYAIVALAVRLPLGRSDPGWARGR